MSGRAPRVLMWTFVVAMVVFLVVPTVILVPMSFSSGSTLRFPPPGFSLEWYANLVASPQWSRATLTSLQVALLTSLLATVLGTVSAFGLVRGRFPGRGLVNALVLSPVIAPVVVVAIGMFAVFVNWRLAGSLLGVVLGHTVLAVPYVVINVGASLRTMDRNLELAAMNLGAGPLKTFWHVTLPRILPGVFAGTLFAFIVSWDETVISIFLSSPIVETLPVVMWGQVRTEVDPTVAAAATVLTAVTVVIYAAGTLARRKGVDAS